MSNFHSTPRAPIVKKTNGFLWVGEETNYNWLFRLVCVFVCNHKRHYPVNQSKLEDKHVAKSKRGKTSRLHIYIFLFSN